MEFNVRARTVRPGGRCFFWWPKGLQSYGSWAWTPPTLRDGWYWFYPSDVDGFTGWFEQWAWGLYVSENEVPGTYQIATGLSGYNISVTVLPPLPRRPIKKVSKNSVSYIQRVLDDGNDVELVPGRYIFNKVLECPINSTIYAYNSIIIGANSSSTNNNIFKPLGSFNFYGATLTADDTIYGLYPSDVNEIFYFYNFPTPSGSLHFKDLEIRKGSLIADWASNAGGTAGGHIIENCIFRNSSIGSLPYNTYIHKCYFYGTNNVMDNHSFFNRYGNESLLASLTFDGTTRGIIFQNNPISGCMILDTKMTNIRGGQINGSECFLIETASPEAGLPDDPQINNNTILGANITNSSGPGLSLYGDFMKDNIFYDMKIHVDHTALDISGLHESGGHYSNTFTNMELDGGITFLGTYGNHTFTNVNIRYRPIRAGNQGIYGSTFQLYDTFPPVHIDTYGWDSYQSTWSTCNIVLDDAVLPITRDEPLVLRVMNSGVHTIQEIPLLAAYDYYIDCTVYGVLPSGDRGIYRIIVKSHRDASGNAVIDNYENMIVDDDAPVTWNLSANVDNTDINLDVNAVSGVIWRIVDIKVKPIKQ